jgi:molybdopterin converting factor small subunit
VKVFVNGDVAGLEHPVAATDRVHVLPAISGGRD